ncbi:MAG TPA: RHS repeat-associated core domain-containing protein [Kofleriaceae bacterium]|nr:RHS repeat-associated core domain-containing protein [Kofleriaceae bacterium]
MSKRSDLLVVCLVAGTFGTANAKTDKKDTTAKTWVVDASHGTFSEQIRVEVPAFRDLTPNLGLKYDSSDGNGWVGVGWSLEGIGIVERASPGKGAPKYNASDIFLLDGEELVACVAGSVSPSCTSGGTHSTKVENYLRIALTGTGTASRWTVTQKDGTRRIYAPVYTVNNNVDVYRWGLSQVIDTRGNTVNYTWAVNQFGCCWEYPQSVSYNGTSVTFYYEQRTDRPSNAVGVGVRNVFGRIKTIDVTVSGSRVRAYKLSYGTSGSTSRSLLTSVQQFGTDATLDGTGTVTGGTSLPAITMQYQSGAPSFVSGTTDNGVSNNTDADYFAIDINGDGKTDMLEIYNACFILCTRYRVAHISTGSGFVQSSSDSGMATATTTRFLTADVNGDGKGDIIELYESWGSERRRVWLSDGTRFNQASDACCMKTTSADSRYFALDVNGDGKTDLVEQYPSVLFGAEGRRVWFSNGTAFTEGQTLNFDTDPKYLVLTLDVNGDGKMDMVQLKDYFSAVQRTTWISTGTGFATGVTDQCDGQVVEAQKDGVVTAWSPFLAMDVNGDGKDDLVNLASFFGNRVRRVWHSTGKGFTEVSEVSVPFYDAGDWFLAEDVNGDGRSDLITIESVGLGIEQRKIWLSVGDNFVGGAVDTQSAFGDGTKLLAADVNGDGLSEMVTMDSFFGIRSRRIWNMTGPYPDLMTSIRGSLGATTSVAYAPSSAWTNTNNPPLMQTAASITLNDGRGGVWTTNYTYSGGLYDRIEHRFMGFRYEKETRPCITGESVCPYNETWFRQDYGSASKPERIDHRAGNGQLLSSEIYEYTTNGATVPWTSLRTGNWDYTFINAGTACPGADCKRKYVSRTFNAYGDAVTEVEYGDYDTTGDEDTQSNTFVPNTTAYIVNKPADVKSFAGVGTAGTLLNETLTYYDGAATWNQAPSVGNPTKESRWLSSPSSFVNTSKEYDTYGNVTATINALGARTTTAFDATYHIFATSETNALSQVTTTSWNTVCGEKSQLVDLNSQTTALTYDPLCRLSQRTEPGGNFERHTWLGLGDATSQYEQIETPAADGGATAMWRREYLDGHKRIWRTVKQGPAASGNIYVDTGYNARGEQRSKTRPYYWASGPQPTTYTTTTDYDALDRPIKVTHADGSFKTTSYSLWTTTETDELGHSMINIKDADGRRVTHKEYVGGAYQVTAYLYDARGNLIRSTDPSGNSINYVNDSLARTTAMTDPDSGASSYAFDGANRLTSQTDAKAQRTDFTYDALDRKTGKTSKAGTGSAVTVSWTYDQVRTGYFNKGKLTAMTDSAGSKTLDYDAAGRSVKTVRVTGGTSYTFTRGFDAGGRALWTTYPDGDTLGTPGTPLVYDSAGRLASIPGYVTSVLYGADDKVARIDSANGAVNTRTYSAQRGWLTRISTTAGATTIQNLGYTRNARGLITSVTSPIANEGWTYAYDELDRLLSATNTSDATQNQTFTYNAIGNITANSRLGSYTYGTSRPHAVTAAGSNTYSYDAAGLMTAGGGRTLTWDGDNRLATISGPANVAYTYDADGARVQQIENGITRRFLGDNFEIQVGGNASKYVTVGDITVARRDGTTSYWVHTDHLGSIQAETSSSGAEAHRKKYRPYGETLSSTGTSEPRGFTGQRQDASGLIDLHNRSYDPALGRFVSPDLVIDGENTVGLNRYAYCNNNPVTRTDTEGTADEPEDKDKKDDKKAHGNWITRAADAAKHNGEFADEPPTIGEPGQDKVRYDFYQKPVAVAGSHFKAVVTDESGKNVGTYSLAGWDAKYNDTNPGDDNYKHAGTIYKDKESLKNFNDAYMNVADGNRYALGDSNAAIDHAIKAIGEDKGIFTLSNPQHVPAAAYGYNNFDYQPPPEQKPPE